CKTDTQQTAIDQNKNAITLKADQTTVDKINGTVNQLQSSLSVQAGQIQEKVSASDVSGMLTGYATQEYTQSLVTQKADDWNLNLTKLKNDTQTSVTNLSATVDGIQAQVYNSDGSSKITQLSNLIQSKVGTDDFNNLKQAVGLQTLDSADINNMKTNGHYFVHNLANNPIGGWVYVDVTGDGSSRIRQDVYQDIGNKHKYRRWIDTYWTDWEEGATYTEINQLQDAINLRVTKGDLISQINLQAGTALIQSNKLVLDAGTTVITGEAFIPSAAISSISADKIMLGSTSLYNSDGTMNLVNTNDGTTSKISVTQGSVNFDGVNKTASIIRFASDNNTNAFTVNPTGATVTPTLFFERFDQPVGHWLGFTRNSIQEEGVAFNTWDNDGERFAVACHARFEKNLRTLGTLSQGSWDGTTAKPESGVLTIKNGNTIWSGSDFLAVGSNVTNTYTGILAKAFVQQSTLSSKTNIETVDPKDALDLINQTDIRSYQYKSDVAQGKAKRYTSLIIDDVNDVSKYYAPDEFTNEERTGRDDGSAVGYLFLAVKELTRRIKNLEEKLNG
ncbi:pyocin knob domain-containing S74 family peptidase, partial [Limosilactobacillus fermentum]